MPDVNIPADNVWYNGYELLKAKLTAISATAHVPEFVSGGNIQADADNTGAIETATFLGVPLNSAGYGSDNELEAGQSLPINSGAETRTRLSTRWFRNPTADIQVLHFNVTES